MFRNVSRRATVFPAEREPLQQPHRDEEHRRGYAYRAVSGQQADHERGQTHDHDGHKERVLAPDHIAETPEHDRAERPHGETRREAEQGEDEAGRRIDAGEEGPADIDGERARQIKVVPLEHRAQR